MFGIGLYGATLYGSPSHIQKTGNRWSKTINVSNAGGAAKTDWPVRINIGSGDIDWSRTRTDGLDVSVRASDGVTLYPFWVEKWDVAAQIGLVWVKIPSLSAGGSTTALFYYGLQPVGDLQTPSSVFPFAEVFTGPESIRGSFDDSSGFFVGNVDAHPNPISQQSGLREQSNVVYRQSAPEAQRYTLIWSANDNLYVMFSPDGETWTANSGNPVFAGAEDPYVALNIDGTPWMDSNRRMYVYFERKGGGSSQDDCGLARTRDFNVWEMWTGSAWSSTLTTSGNVLPRGGAGTWDETFTGSPTVIHDGTQFVMLYEGATPALLYRTGVAFSSDGITWTKGVNNPTFNLEVIDEIIKIGTTYWFFGHEAGYFVHRYKTTVAPSGWDSTSAIVIDDPVRWGNGGSSPGLFHDGTQRMTYYPPVLGQASDKLEHLEPLGGSTWRFQGNGPGGLEPTVVRVGVDSAGKLTYNTLSANSQLSMATKNTALFGPNIAVRFRHKRGATTASHNAQVAIGNGAIATIHPFGSWADGVSLQHDSDDVLKFRGYTGGSYTGDIQTKAAPYGFDPTVLNDYEMRYRGGASNLLELYVGDTLIMWGAHDANKDTNKGVLISGAYTTTQDFEFLVVRKFDGVDATVSFETLESAGVWTVKTGSVGEVDSASRLATRQLLGGVTETDTAQPVAKSKIRGLGQVIESDTANVVAMVVPFVVTEYRYRNDDGNETTATWKAAVNTSVAMAPNTPFRLRVAIKNGSSIGVFTEALYLEFSADGGAWQTVGAGLAVVPTSSTVVNDGATTQQISSGGFTAGRLEETPSTFGMAPGTTVGVGNKTEYEWVLVTGSLTGVSSVALRVAASNGAPFVSTSPPTFTKSGQVVVIGQAVESDAATVVAKTKSRALAQVVQPATAQPIARTKQKAVTQPVETDTSQQMQRRKVRVLGQVAEVDTSQAMTRFKQRVVSTVAESDTSQLVTRLKRKALGQSSESDTATVVGRLSLRVLGLATETDSTLGILRVKVKTLISTSETDAAISIGRSKTRVTGQAVETDVSRPVGGSIVRAVAQVIEADSATTAFRVKTRLIGGTAEGDAAQPVAKTKRRSLGQIVESNISQAITRRKNKLLGIASEADVSRPVAKSKQRTVGQVAETDLSQALVRLKRKTIGSTTESDTATTVQRLKARLLGRATELSTAAALGRGKVRPVAQVGEVHAALALGRSKRLGLGLSAETDTSQALSTLNIRLLGQPSEVSTGLPVLRKKLRVVGQGVETEISSLVARAKRRSLVVATETASASLVLRIKRRVLGQTSEADTATLVGKAKSRVLGQTTELTTATAVARRKLRLLQQAPETSMAQGATSSKLKGVLRALETEFSQSVLRGGRGALLGQTSEADSARVVLASVNRVLSLAIENDSAIAVLRRKVRSVGRSSEVDAAIVLSRGRQVITNRAAEIDSATTTSMARGKAVGRASEASAALGVGRLKSRVMGVVTESNLARGISTKRFYILGINTEVDNGITVGKAKTFTLSRSVEVDQALVVVWPGVIPVIAIPSGPVGSSSISASPVGVIAISSLPVSN